MYKIRATSTKVKEKKIRFSERYHTILYLAKRNLSHSIDTTKLDTTKL